MMTTLSDGRRLPRLVVAARHAAARRANASCLRTIVSARERRTSSSRETPRLFARVRRARATLSSRLRTLTSAMVPEAATDPTWGQEGEALRATRAAERGLGLRGNRVI